MFGPQRPLGEGQRTLGCVLRVRQASLEPQLLCDEVQGVYVRWMIRIGRALNLLRPPDRYARSLVVAGVLCEEYNRLERADRPTVVKAAAPSFIRRLRSSARNAA